MDAHTTRPLDSCAEPLLKFVSCHSHSLLCDAAFFVVMGQMDRDGLFCGELSVMGALDNPTTFCIIIGLLATQLTKPKGPDLEFVQSYYMLPPCSVIIVVMFW